MSQQEEPLKVGVAVMGGAQAAYDEIYFQQLKQPESVDTDIPPSQRSAILDGIRDFVEDQQKTEPGTEDHDRELFYLTTVLLQSSLLTANANASLIEGAEPFPFPLTDYLGDSGIKAYIMPPALYAALHCKERGIQEDALVIVFDAPFEGEDGGGE